MVRDFAKELGRPPYLQARKPLFKPFPMRIDYRFLVAGKKDIALVFNSVGDVVRIFGGHLTNVDQFPISLLIENIGQLCEMDETASITCDRRMPHNCFIFGNLF